MIDPDDLVQMQADLVKVRQDNEVSIILRRGNGTLPAQTVRIARQGTQAQRRDTIGAEQAVGRVIVLGSITLDIEVADRFTIGGLLYEVRFVRPNKLAAVVAEAEALK